MAVFAGKSQFANGGANDTGIFGRFYGLGGRWGNERVVYSGATGGGSGITPADAATTLIGAQTLATASNDDLVHVLPGHTEVIAGAAGMTFSKAGVRYQGVGVGASRPTISYSTSTAAQLIVSGAGVTFANMIFDFTGFSAIVAAISVTGADVAFEDCTFVMSTGTNAPVLGILTAATAARFRIERCRFTGPFTSTDTVTACIKHEVGIDYLIKDNFFHGKFSAAILNATAVLGGQIDNNVMKVTGTETISLHASSTAFITRNTSCVASGTAPIIAAGASLSQNRYTTEGNGPTAGTADAT